MTADIGTTSPKHALRAGSLPELLSDVHVEGQTGLLRFEHKGERCDLRFVRGHIVYAAATARELRLGEVLVAEGLLRPEHLEEATRIVLEQGHRLGEALQQLGLVDTELLEDFLSIHVREILVHVFTWTEGAWAFEEQDPGTQLAPDFPLKMSTGELLMEAVRRVPQGEPIRFALGDPERLLLPSTEPLVRFQRINLNPTDAFVLSRVDGTLSAHQVLEVTPLPRDQVEASLVGLIATGMIEVAPPEPTQAELETQARRQEILDLHTSLGGRGNRELLGVSAQSTGAEIKAAYFRLAKRFHPDVHHEPALADMRERLEQIFGRLTDAYQALKGDSRRIRPIGSQGPASPGTGKAPAVKSAAASPPTVAPGPTGEEVLRNAEERFEQGRYWECVALAETALRYEEPALQGRARLLLARAYLTHPGTEKQAEQVLLAALREAPENVEALVLLGKTYERAGVTARAAAMYRKALDLRPRHREAKAALDALGPAPSPASDPKAGGLLGRLRRKR